MATHVCTIIARNYLPAARVLFESFARHNPKGTFSVLIIDDRRGEVHADAEPFEILNVQEIGIDKVEMHKMAAIYNVTEFATAVKPWLLHTLIERWGESVIYLDPDIMVFRPLDDIVTMAQSHDVVITPHATHPIPRDDHRVSESEILAAGIYNLGFIAVGVSGTDFLEFWKTRLRRECISDPSNMRFVDQRWVDFAPAMFDALILKDPTYNVAYWNLHARDFSLDAASGMPMVNGEPVHFFHFSGYDPRVPELLSKYQGGEARILFSNEPELQEFCTGYGSELFAHEYKSASRHEYGFANLEVGLKYDESMRLTYRQALLEAERDGDELLPPNPFESAEIFLLWLNSPAPGDVLSRYLKSIYDRRWDLQFHFPDANGDGVQPLLDWCWDEASKGNFEHRLIPSAPTPQEYVVDQQTEAVKHVAATDGIEVSGYFKAEMGVGELGRNTVKAVGASGIAYSTRTDTDVIHRQELEFHEQTSDDHAVNVVCMNADSMVHFAYRSGPDYFRDRYTIGVWTWELEEFPVQFDESFDYVDEVWACSAFTRDAIAARGLKPVYTLPVTVDRSPSKIVLSRGDLGIPEGFMFLFCFDLLSIFERKNPLAIIDAFTEAFAPNEGPVLVIKALNGDKRLAGLEKIRIRARGRSDIVVLDEYLDHDQNIALFDSADCYVSLHRSEGLGLTIAEAMALGKPVIATAYSGNMDFMNDENSYLVPFTYCEVPDGADPYRPGARWADPDVAEASARMRYVVDHPEEAAQVGARAREYMLEHHAPAVAATFVKERYARAMETLGRREGSPRSDDHSRAGRDRSLASDLATEAQAAPVKDATPPLIALAGRPVAYDGVTRFGKAGRFARRVLRRLLLVRDNQQQEVNMALAMGTEHLARLWNEMSSRLNRLQNQQQHQLQRAERERQSLSAKFDFLNRTNVEQGANLELLRQASQDLVARLVALERKGINDVSGLQSDLDAQRSRLEALRSRLEVVPYMTDPDTFTLRDAPDSPVLGFDANEGVHDGYASFEDTFRGPEDFIRTRQEVFLPFLNADGVIVDIGSGRGEFLDVLANAGLTGIGVDSDPSMAARAIAKGHQVMEQDALSYLRAQADSSVATIFSAQFVEHLRYDDLRALIDESQRVLCEDGVLIMETVNPYCLSSFRTFWTDLSHERPIFPEVLLTFVRDCGFRSARVIFPNGTGELEVDRWREGEYAVIATR